MSDIHIHRDHALGLTQARKVAKTWMAEAESRFAMACDVTQGETSDTVHFTRSGVHGELIVAGDHFELTAKLGFLLGAFAGSIKEQIEGNLDELLAAQGGRTKKAPAAKKSRA